jgi:autotransporter-like protein
VLAPALLLTPFVAIDRAAAQCAPATPVNGADVTCKGATGSPNTPVGYGDGNVSPNSITVQSGASVTGSDRGLQFFDGTVNNFGTITAGNLGIGIFAKGTATVSGSGKITAGAGGDGIAALGDANVSGSGTITAGTGGFGIEVNGNANVKDFSGAITAGARGFGIRANQGNANVTGFSGTITAGDGGTGMKATLGDANLTGSGKITTGTNGIGIQAGRDANVTNFSGAITAGTGGFGIQAGRDANVTGSGKITAGDKGTGIQAGRDVNVTGFSGAITAGVGGVGINAFGDANVTSFSGAITAGENGRGIIAGGDANVTGTGKITAGMNGFGILTGGNANVTDFSGTITAGANGASIFAHGNANVTSFSGNITAGDKGVGIETEGDANVSGSGAITAGAGGIGIAAGRDANVTGFSGAIRAGDQGVGISANGTANLTDFSGAITAGAKGVGIFASTANVTSSGTITAGAGGIGIQAGTANLTNFGTITVGAKGIGIDAGTATVFNSGAIRAGTGGFGIVTGTANLTNSGTISGGIGIFGAGISNITNSGIIIGLDGTAMRLGGKADTLTLLPGSRILGAIDMGGGNDVVNFVSPGGVAQLVTLNNFTGTISTSGVGPIVHNTSQIATLDPTAFGQTDRTLMDFTGGVSSLVQSRLGGAPPNGSIQAVSYAPDGAMPNGLIRKAPFAGYAAPTVVWTGGFGGTRTQDATGDLFHATSSVWGGLLGVDRQVRGDLLIGGFVGGGTGRLTINKSSEGVHTDYLAGGVYGRFDWASHFLDFTVQGGSAENKSNRLVMSNLALSTNGLETATARYSGWYVSPELTYGMRYAIGNGNMLTPFARVRYLAGIFDGYSEQGSGQNLSVGRRTLQDVEERSELELSKTASFGNDATMKTSVHGGVIALQRLGDTNVNTVLIGQNLTFAMPGKDSTVGAVAGTGVDVTIGKSVSVFGAFEGTVMSDKSRTATAKAGLRVGF